MIDGEIERDEARRASRLHQRQVPCRHWSKWPQCPRSWVRYRWSLCPHWPVGAAPPAPPTITPLPAVTWKMASATRSQESQAQAPSFTHLRPGQFAQSIPQKAALGISDSPPASASSHLSSSSNTPEPDTLSPTPFEIFLHISREHGGTDWADFSRPKNWAFLPRESAATTTPKANHRTRRTQSGLATYNGLHPIQSIHRDISFPPSPTWPSTPPWAAPARTPL